jgi:tetratricopeptide (TPR) repeat protein
MTENYGGSFARDAISRGDYEEAIEAATQAMAGGDHGPEPLFDRAQAYELQEEWDLCLADFESAIRANAQKKVFDRFLLDDAYFSALVSAGRERGGMDGVGLLGRYAVNLPDGTHLEDAKTWQARLRGALPSLLDKTDGLG